MLNSRVLVLNRLWQAVNTCTAKRAFSLLYRGYAQVIATNGGSFETYDFEAWKYYSQEADDHQEVVHTIKFKLLIPRIILLLFYDRFPSPEIRFTRKNIFVRDNYTCQYCGRKFDPSQLNIDHVIPRNKGGKNTWENVVCSCHKCNLRKGDRTLEEAGMALVKRPRKPRWHAFNNVSFGMKMHESWKHFLDPSLWKVELGEDNEGEIGKES